MTTSSQSTFRTHLLPISHLSRFFILRIPRKKPHLTPETTMISFPSTKVFLPSRVMRYVKTHLHAYAPVDFQRNAGISDTSSSSSIVLPFRTHGRIVSDSSYPSSSLDVLLCDAVTKCDKLTSTLGAVSYFALDFTLFSSHLALWRWYGTFIR